MSAKKGLNLTLKIWRQKNNKSKGQFETYKISDVSTDSSFLRNARYAKRTIGK
jgi:succinate dehydrogenase / fumarate reductase iron-sulfur subunit